MTTLFNRHTNSDLAHTTRAAQRKLKQLEIEKEQRMEDAEALKMTEVCGVLICRNIPDSSVRNNDESSTILSGRSRSNSVI